jgi:hypothetical protein
VTGDFPHGFVLSEAAIYSFRCQEVYPDVVSFAAAIPPHLRPLFLIPIKLDQTHVAARVAAHCGCGRVSNTPDADLFGDKTFVYDDTGDGPDTVVSDSDSIFNSDSRPVHQEFGPDENIQSPTDTGFMSDVDMTQYGDYPYRSKEKPRHSSVRLPTVVLSKIRRVAFKPDALQPRVPEKIKRNAESCTVTFVSYSPKTRLYTFSVDSGNGAKSVHASLSEVDEVALSCNCPFWQYNGPEFHAKENSYMLGQPYGTAAPPDVRDPDRKFWLCKHAYAVLKRLEHFVQEVAEENWDLDDDDLMKKVDEEWDRLEGVAEIPQEELADEDVDLDVEWDASQEDGEPVPDEEPAAPEPPAEEPEPPAEEPVYDDYSQDEEPPPAEEPPAEEPPAEDPEVDSDPQPEEPVEVLAEEPDDYSGEPEAVEEPEEEPEAVEEPAEDPEAEEPDAEEPDDYSGEEKPSDKKL